MAGINWNAGSEEIKKNNTNVKNNLPPLPGNSNTDGTGTAVTVKPAGTQSTGNTGTQEATYPVYTASGDNKNYFAPSTYVPGTAAKPEGTENAEPTAEGKAETSLEELRNKYSAEIRDSYNYSAEKMKNERDAALRENWILQQQAKAALPEQMAASGINGGASETALADLISRYQGNRNDIQNEYISNLGDLGQSAAEKTAEAERSYNERWLDYLTNLAEAEKEYELKKKYG